MRWTRLSAAFGLLSVSCGTSGATGPVTGEASCGAVIAFAEQGLDIGITHDYEPSRSPSDLATRVDAVVEGLLTGDSLLVATGEEGTSRHPHHYVGYALEVREILAGRASGSETVHVFVEYNPAHVTGAELQEAPAAGLPVIVFGYELGELGSDALLATPVEGLATGCPGVRPVGWVGQHGTWADMESLNAVAEAVRR